MKDCPFNIDKCSRECSLFVSDEELNEAVVNRLVSIGTFQRGGVCSFKLMALSQSRYIFENTSVKR